MASLHKRGKKYYVVVSIKDVESGKYDSNWIPYDDEEEAIKACEEITAEEKKAKSEKRASKAITNATRTVQQLVYQYIDLVGPAKWSPTTYTNNVARAENYILPHIGDVRVQDCSVLFMDKYFAKLKNMNAVCQAGKNHKRVSAKTCEEVHKFLKAMFNKAVEWEMIKSNPCRVKNSTLSEYISKRPPFWTMPQFLDAAAKIEEKEDFPLLTALFISVSTTMREGEVCGLQWERCHISDRDIESGDCRVDIDRELYRLKKDVMRKLNNKSVIFVFPDMFGTAKSSLVLKLPKSTSSIRTVWLPPTVARMMQRLKAQQNAQKELLGMDYRDNDLVIAHPDGRPVEGCVLNDWLQEVIKRYDLPRVTYHSTRHTSTTYKLKLARGDIKNVQGDTGHGSAQMVTEVYAEIVDMDRKYNATNFESAYFSGLKSPNSDYVVDLVEQAPATLASQQAKAEKGQQLSSNEIVGFLSVIEKNPELVRQLLAMGQVST